MVAGAQTVERVVREAVRDTAGGAIEGFAGLVIFTESVMGQTLPEGDLPRVGSESPGLLIFVERFGGFFVEKQSIRFTDDSRRTRDFRRSRLVRLRRCGRGRAFLGRGIRRRTYQYEDHATDPGAPGRRSTPLPYGRGSGC
jgi:hypothetical protein